LTNGRNWKYHGVTYLSDRNGEVRIPVAPGPVAVTVVKEGYAAITTSITVEAGQVQPVLIDLQAQPTVEEHVTVSATWTDRRVERSGDAG
jgi:hypothetical protein